MIRKESFELDNAILERSVKVLEEFGQVAISQVKEKRLLAALEDVKKYWVDCNRPALTLFSCEAVGGSCEVAEDAALMFTLASSGFGIHDDIIDKSSHKHFRRTILGAHGIETALLAGDLLIVKAWSVGQKMMRKTHNLEQLANVLDTYGNLSLEICEAELLESSCRRKIDTPPDFYGSILLKEAAETEACCRIGAMIGEGTPLEIEALSDYGRSIGFISRLANELEDCLNLQGELIHRIENESLPLPLLYAARSSSENYLKIKGIVEKDHPTPSDAKSLLKICFETEAFEYVHNLAKKKQEMASLKLNILKPSKAQISLKFLINKAYVQVAELCI